MSALEVLLDSLDESRERLLVAIEPLDDEAMLQKGVYGDWSVADILSNMTAWESELVTGLLKIDQNRGPARLLAALADPSGYDKAHFEAMQDRDLDQIFADLQQVRIQVEDWLAEFSESDLTDPQRYRWLEGKALRDIIASATYRHEQEFLPAIEAFAQEWLEIESAAAETTISLTMIEPSIEEKKDDKPD